MCFRNLFGGGTDSYKVTTDTPETDNPENKEEAPQEDDDSVFDLTDLYMIDEL